MKKYYIHNGSEQQGPFSLDDLMKKNVTRETMIWFDGAESWLQADKIEDIKDLFKSVPPPITMTKSAPPQYPSVKNFEADLPKKNKTTIYVFIGLLGILLIAGFAYNYQLQKQKQIEQQLEEQSSKIQEQEKIEQQRLAEEQKKREAASKLKRTEKLQELKTEYDNAITSLRFSREKLEEIKQFQLLRTSSEKENQIQSQLEVIRSWENEVDRLKNEIDRY